MRTIQFNAKSKELRGEINLPASKSITNRALILQHLSLSEFSIANPSLADDSVLLSHILTDILLDHPFTKEIFVDNAGTVMRFLTALLSIKSGDWLLTGSGRMQQRPIADLVDALHQLGAAISYSGTIGFPPLQIKGKQLKGGHLKIETNTSSQFVTSLLLIAPFLENGLSLTFTGKTVSKPYILMSLKMLDYFGIKYTYIDDCIEIQYQAFQSTDIVIESDWSAASYWYEMVAFSENADLKLKGLTNSGWQGDAILAEIFNDFGVKTEFLNEGVRLTKTNSIVQSFSFDFTDYPDIAPTLAVCCAGLGIKAELKGLDSLRIKECNRLNALETELNKMGYQAFIINNHSLIIKPSAIIADTIIHTYNDHRMAMSFAPLAMLNGSITLDAIDVVKKSYPGFWNDIQSVGFRID